MGGNGEKVTIRFDRQHADGLESMAADYGTNPTDAARKGLNAHMQRLGYVNGGEPTALESVSRELSRSLFVIGGAMVLAHLLSPTNFLGLAGMVTLAGMLFTLLWMGEPTFTYQYRRVVEA